MATLSDGVMAAGAFAGAFLAILTFVALSWRKLRSLARIMDDLQGEPGGPGREPVPGVVARLAQHEAHLMRIDLRLERIETRLSYPYGGE